MVPQPDIIEHFGNADAVPQPPERCLSRKAGIVQYCLNDSSIQTKKRGPANRQAHIYYTTFVKAISIHNMHE